MIEKISFNTQLVNKSISPKNNKKQNSATNSITPETIPQVKLSSPFLEKYYINFGAKKEKTYEETNSPKTGSSNKMKMIEENVSPYGEELLDDSRELAHKLGHNEVSQIHVLRVGLSNILDFINKLDSGELSYDDESSFSAYYPLESELGEDIITNNEKRSLIKPVIENEIKNLDEKLESFPKASTVVPSSKISFSKDFLNDVYSLYRQENCDDMDGDTLVHDRIIMDAALFPSNDKIKKEITVPFCLKLKDEIQLDKRQMNERTYLSFYDNKAENIWNNLAIGTNMVILYDKETTPSYIVNSFLNVFENNDKGGYGKLKKSNTKIINFNDNRSIDNSYIKRKINELGKDKNNNYVMLMSIMDKDLGTLAIDKENVKLFMNAPENIKFVMLADKDIYYNSSSSSTAKNLFAEFGEISVPLMNMAQAKRMFHEQPKLMEKIKKQFTAQAIDKCVEASNQLKGNYPEKAQKIMELISAYYVDKAKITQVDVQNYVREAKEIFKPNDLDNDSSIKIVFDTGIKLKDMVGSPTTKKEANSIVDRIKDKSIGSKGFVIYSQDGSVGAGRKYTARAIAGETKSPYVEINAVDFGTKEVDLFGGGNLSPEASMKKLFGIVKTQAETNPLKSAVLFIENFDYFSYGEMVSEYHEKAMSQLIRELTKAQEQGLNIVVIGSMNDPRNIGEATSKSFKFIDQIEVESPGCNQNARAEIVDYYIKQKKIKLAGDKDEQKIIKEHINSLTEWASYIEILTLLDKAKNVARERKHAAIEKSDFTEAYLQLTTGRSSSAEVPNYRKEIVTSHECGHALNATIMEEFVAKRGKPYHLGEPLNFITLDPRGYFSGAVFTKNMENPEMSFEHVFSDIVCDFGGNSCEKHFYNQDGSWGITCDMQMATNSATRAIAIMGQGKHFGKKSLEGMTFISEEDKNKMNKDIDVILKNAQVVSEAITQVYEDFNREFTKKYSDKVGTGECIIQREEFLKMLNEWKEKQTPEKKEEFKLLYQAIHDVIEATKRGVICQRESD